MKALTTMTKNQTKVFLREPMSVFFGLVFPALLLLLIGLAFPGATEPSPDLGGLSLVEIYAPVVIIFGLATVAVSVLPATIGTDRERGILRRLSTTPVHPRVLVVTHLSVQLLVAICASVTALLVGRLIFNIPLPENPIWFIISFLLAAAALLGVGLLIGALVPSATSAQAVGMIVYIPLLFFAGVYFPRQVMSEGMRAVTEFTPTGAAVDAMSGSWAGGVPQSSSLIMMAAYALGTGLLATVLFRWE